MKIGILTFFESNNYGTVLQAYALQEFLLNCGHDVEFVHIKRNVNSASSQYNNQTIHYTGIDKLKIKWHSLGESKQDEIKNEKFAAFRKQMLNINPIYYENDAQLKADYPRYDLYLSGGDQIWNPYHKVFSSHYMWDFLPDGVSISSYSSSFGVDKIKDEVIISEMRKWLKRYSYICVRESSGVDIVKTMGLTATQVLDPVFLIREKWEDFLVPVKEKKKYCLVYALIEYSKIEDTKILNYAKDNNCEIKILPYNRRNSIENYTREFSAGPEDFINLIANAEYIFTNSFHGIAFAILFNKQFSLLSAVSDEAKSKRGRLDDLLITLDIDDGKKINYQQVNNKINRLIDDSMEMLRKISKF